MAEDAYTAPDFAAAALITIDTQRDVLDGGALEIAGTSAALPQMSALLRGFRAARAPIVHVVRLYAPDIEQRLHCDARSAQEQLLQGLAVAARVRWTVLAPLSIELEGGRIAQHSLELPEGALLRRP